MRCLDVLGGLLVPLLALSAMAALLAGLLLADISPPPWGWGGGWLGPR